MIIDVETHEHKSRYVVHIVIWELPRLCNHGLIFENNFIIL